MTDTGSATTAERSARLIAELASRRLTLAIAESLTGGLLVAQFIAVPGASAVVSGGIVAYNTELKQTLLGVDAGLLARHGAVHPEVAKQMATGVRQALAVGGEPASIGIATTGVAGPGPQDGQPPGTVFVGIAIGDDVQSIQLRLGGNRDQIRSAVVQDSILRLCDRLEIR